MEVRPVSHWSEVLFRLCIRTYRWVFARRAFYRLNVFLHRLSLAGLGMNNFESHRVSGEVHFLNRYLAEREDCTIIDVGAHRGEWARTVLDVKPGARIFGFEPHPRTFETLQRMSSITALNYGCGRKKETRVLFDRKDGDGSVHASLIEEAITVNKGCDSVQHEVRIVKIDDFIEERGLTRIDLLKVDAEGHEYEVLLGASESIRKGMIDAVQFEFNEMHVFSRVFMNDFFALLPGYDFYRLLPSSMVQIKNYFPLSEIFAYQNVVAMKRDGALLGRSRGRADGIEGDCRDRLPAKGARTEPPADIEGTPLPALPQPRPSHQGDA